MMIPHAKNLRKSAYLPINSDAIYEGSRQTFLHAIKPESKNPLTPIKILVVEDTEICQKIALLTFNQPTYVTDLATSGKEALEKYSQGYDVILLDLGLPDMSGIDVCKHIRKKIGDTRTPIIAYSTISDTLHEECLAAGFSETLMKPTEKKVLDQFIKKLVEKAS
jgi:CheY-like chemotaxis protein